MAPLEIGTLYYVEEAIYKAEKALVTAKFAGLSIPTKKFDPQKDAKKPDFLARNPTGKVPYLETDKGCIFTSNAVARYVARCRSDLALYGSNFSEEGDIDEWLEFDLHEVEIPLMTWVYPVLGMMEEVPSAIKDAQEDVKKALKALEEQLGKSEFLVGNSVTLADIVLVCALKEGFKRVFDPNFRKPFPKTCQWFEKCCKMPQFKAVLGDVKLCAAPEKPRALLPAFAPNPREKAKGTAKADDKATPKAEKTEKKAEKPAEKKPEKSPKAEPKPKAEAKTEKKPAEPKKAPAAPAPMANGGDLDAEIAALGNAIRAKKDELKASGLSGKKCDAHPEVKEMVDKLLELKSRK